VGNGRSGKWKIKRRKMEFGSIVSAILSAIVIGFGLWIIHKISNI
jgi:hypothetical protein